MILVIRDSILQSHSSEWLKDVFESLSRCQMNVGDVLADFAQGRLLLW